MARTFIDIQILHTVPPSCINRDDNGSPKSAVFGGVRRHRVSSQAWKKVTREEFNRHLDRSELGERTLLAVARIAEAIEQRAPELADSSTDLAQTVLTATGIKVMDKKRKTAAGEDTTRAETGYLLFLSRTQIQALADLAIESAANGGVDKKTAKRVIQSDHSIDIALFGRMIADAPDLNLDAACQVAHAISVHAAAAEFDYFTASDDNAAEDNAGAGMIGTVEFVSSTLYRYATIDLTELTHSLGSTEAALRAVDAFVQAFVVSMPTGKQNTFANRTRPDLVLVQVREDQPVNLAGAFEDPVTTGEGTLRRAAVTLASYAAEQDRTYQTNPAFSRYIAAGAAATDAVHQAFNGYAESAQFDELLVGLRAALESRLEVTA